MFNIVIDIDAGVFGRLIDLGLPFEFGGSFCVYSIAFRLVVC